MSSPNLNNVILLGAILAYLSIIFAGLNSFILESSMHLTMCKVGIDIHVSSSFVFNIDNSEQ